MPDDNLKLLRYPNTVECLPSLVDWCGFVRKVTFYKAKATKHMETTMLPSYTALIKRMNCSTCVLIVKVVYKFLLID